MADVTRYFVNALHNVEGMRVGITEVVLASDYDAMLKRAEAAWNEHEQIWQDKFREMESQLAAAQAQAERLREALKAILGWRELRSGADEVPIKRIEELAKAALGAWEEGV